MKKINYNPDILNCLANLSNDEVFTPPNVVSDMLDLLPKDLWTNPKATFLDPFTKSGVFLREITKRLNEGLKPLFPDTQERINHILSKQVFGIAITELTSLLSRRSVYCCKTANSDKSIATCFSNEQGNIIYNRVKHNFINGKCEFCGANQDTYSNDEDKENYAYQFIHTYEPEKFFKDMKFDVIIGNPPYQLGFGLDGGNSSNAKSIYNQFIQQAIKMNPSYIVMITPSRWMTKSSQGVPENWINSMLNCNHFRIMYDYLNSDSCFPNLNKPIKGGVNFFLYDSKYVGKCDYYLFQDSKSQPFHRFDYLNTNNSGILIRDLKAIDILRKVEKIEGKYFLENAKNFSSLVSPKHFFDDSNFLTSNWNDYKTKKDEINCIKYYIHQQKNGWINESQIPKNVSTKNIHKVYIAAAGGSGLDSNILGKPFYGEPNSVCSQTYLVIGYDPKKHNYNKENCLNIITYIKTKFFRYLVSIKKKTQNGPRGVYQFVPMQDFSKPWTDKELYKKYNLSNEEIEYIETMIKPME